MAQIGVAVLKVARFAVQHVDDVGRCQHRAYRLVTPAQPLGNRHQVW